MDAGLQKSEECNYLYFYSIFIKGEIVYYEMEKFINAERH